MKVRRFNQRLFLMAILILVVQWLYACAALPATPDQALLATLTPQPAHLPTTIQPSATFTPVPSPSATNTLIAVPHLTQTPLPTEPPLAVSDPSLGYDCSQVERLPVDSVTAKSLAERLVASYKEKMPTEYIAVEDLWAVERLDEYVLLQMRVSDEAAGIFVMKETPTGKTPREYEYVAGQVWGGWPLPSRYTFPEYLPRELPDAPPELFYCMSLGHYFFQIQDQEELDLRREYSCTLVQSLQVDSPMGWAISHALVDYWKGVIEVVPVELEQVYSIHQLGPFFAIQVRFLVNHRSEPPELFIARETAQGYEFVAQTSGGGPDRTYLLRYLNSQDTSIPPELLVCLDLYAWLLNTPTPAP
jgi:hypothetical protein